MTLLLFLALIVLPLLFTAVPILEAVVGVVLLSPVIWFLLGTVIEAVGFSILQGWIPFLSYLTVTSALLVFTRSVFGVRRQLPALREYSSLGIFILFYLIAYYYSLTWPDFIALGERLRDYSILASTISSPLEPREPWLSGAVLNYYVYWYRFGHFISTILFLPVWETYHVMTAFAVALYGSMIFELLRVVCRVSMLGAAVGAVVASFGSNVAGFLMVIYPEPTYWGPSRVVKGAINEFPAWSFIHGDLHPHFMNLAAIPFFILLLFRAVTVAAFPQNRAIIIGCLCLLGMLFMMAANAWEVPLWGAVFASIALVGLQSTLSPLRRRLRGACSIALTPQIFQASGAAIGLLVAIITAIVLRTSAPLPLLLGILTLGVAVFLFFFPWGGAAITRVKILLQDSTLRIILLFSIVVGVALRMESQHIVPEGATPRLVGATIPLTQTLEIMLHFGFFLGLVAIGSILLLTRVSEKFLAVLFLVLSLAVRDAAVFVVALLGLQLVRLGFVSRRGRPVTEDIFADGILLAGLGLILVPEILFLDDPYGGENERMNTIFKVYIVAWGLLCVGSISVFARGCSNSIRWFISEMNVTQVRMTAVTVTSCVALVLTLPFFFAAAKLRKPGYAQPGVHEPASEGLNEIEARFPGSVAVIARLRDEGESVVLEAQGNAYDYTTFVTTLAGKTAFLGWANHINLLTKRFQDKIQSDVYGEVRRREQVTQAIYTESSCQSRLETAKKEGIDFIVVGVREQEKYAAVKNLDFSCFGEVVKEKQYALYQTL